MAKDKGGRPSKGRLPKTVKVHGVRWKVVPRRQAVLEGEEAAFALREAVKRIEVTVRGGELASLVNLWQALLSLGACAEFIAANTDIRARPRKSHGRP